MVKSLKIIPEWETCNFIEVVKNKAARFLLQKVVNCLRYTHSQHIESHLGKKQPQAKILIAFLFSQHRFNNFSSDALFHGGHLVMRSKRCAVQNQQIP